MKGHPSLKKDMAESLSPPGGFVGQEMGVMMGPADSGHAVTSAAHLTCLSSALQVTLQSQPAERPNHHQGGPLTGTDPKGPLCF